MPIAALRPRVFTTEIIPVIEYIDDTVGSCPSGSPCEDPFLPLQEPVFVDLSAINPEPVRVVQKLKLKLKKVETLEDIEENIGESIPYIQELLLEKTPVINDFKPLPLISPNLSAAYQPPPEIKPRTGDAEYLDIVLQIRKMRSRRHIKN